MTCANCGTDNVLGAEVLLRVRHADTPRLPVLRHDERAGGEVLQRVRDGTQRRRDRQRPVRRRHRPPVVASDAPGAGRRAAPGQRPLRRPHRLHGLRRGARCGGRPGDPDALLRAGLGRHRPLWRHGREVHRRRGHGRLGDAGRARGRCRARGSSGPRARRRRAGPGAGHPGAGRRPDRRSRGHARRHEPGHGRGRPRQHRQPPPVDRPGRAASWSARPRSGQRRRPSPSSRPGSRCSRARTAPCRPGGRCGSSPSGAATAGRTCRSRRSSGARTSSDCSRDALNAVGRDRRARMVSITGPGGIGKSRLAWELEKYLDGVDERTSTSIAAGRPPTVRASRSGRSAR